MRTVARLGHTDFLLVWEEQRSIDCEVCEGRRCSYLLAARVRSATGQVEEPIVLSKRAVDLSGQGLRYGGVFEVGDEVWISLWHDRTSTDVFVIGADGPGVLQRLTSEEAIPGLAPDSGGLEVRYSIVAPGRRCAAILDVWGWPSQDARPAEVHYHVVPIR